MEIWRESKKLKNQNGRAFCNRTINSKSIKNCPVNDLTSQLCTGLFNFLTVKIGIWYLRARFVIPYNEIAHINSGRLWMEPL